MKTPKLTRRRNPGVHAQGYAAVYAQGFRDGQAAAKRANDDRNERLRRKLWDWGDQPYTPERDKMLRAILAES